MPFYGMLLGVMPSISIKLIVLIHWILVVWALVGFGTSAYGWCNITALAIGIWAIADRQSVDALFMFIMMQLFSIVVDIVILAVYFDGRGTGVYKFSAAMCIINLILKPFSSVLLYQMYRDRGGEYNINFGPHAPSYEHIGDDSGSSAEFRNPLQPSQPAYIDNRQPMSDNKNQPLV
ncbi:type-1 angiotensin II receptor-associated protein-like isoform X1 [Styela clava]|uniref:type-1 angiotensin II receptor-associated protein-like isoform X1 n=1 Tax=Styela clava TaxID=7725 RepID=UPI001939429A|nr:type-1 angiotensin II receptor-associated protein-like isoform X1 [Styela clava]